MRKIKLSLFISSINSITHCHVIIKFSTYTMLNNSKGLALTLLVFNIILFFTKQANGQLPPIFPGQQSPPAAAETCPKNTVRLKIACADVLGFPVLPVGAILNPLRTPCCKLIEGLLDIEVAVCFCRAISLNSFVPRASIPVSLVLLFNYCQKGAPPGFVCETS